MPQVERPLEAGEMMLIALGSNATSRHGPPPEIVARAMDAIDTGPIRVLARSRLYRTPCFPAGAGADYVNAAVLCHTALSPGEVLERLHRIERAFDRVRKERWASRTLDLDLLTMGERVLPDMETLRHWVELAPERQREEAPGGLVLPHPRIQDRAFVLVPAAEVAPDWRHPLTGQTLAEMRDALPEAERAEIVALD